MSKSTIAFRIEQEDRDALDELVPLFERDRSYLINEAIRNYLKLHLWQTELIKERLAKADRDEPGVAHDEVFAKLRKRIDRRAGVSRRK